MITNPFTESESSNADGATKRKRKRRPSPGGLGRGLARILTDSNATAMGQGSADSGLLQLVGGETSAKATKVRKFVVDTALAALAEAFSLDGLILATHPVSTVGSNGRKPGNGNASDAHEGFNAPTFLAATLPPSWSLDSQILFEVYGNLWRVLKDDVDGEAQESASTLVARQWHTEVDHHQVWMARMDDGANPVAVVAIRPEPFSEPEAQALAAVMASVVDACSETNATLAIRRSIRAGTAVSLKSEGADVLAEVTAQWEPFEQPESDGAKPATKTGSGPTRRSGVGRASDTVAAVARGAAKACRPRCEITFAGASDLDDAQVSVVMIKDANRGLRLGFAVRPHGDHSGAAEAVFTAAAPSQRLG